MASSKSDDNAMQCSPTQTVPGSAKSAQLGPWAWINVFCAAINRIGDNSG